MLTLGPYPIIWQNSSFTLYSHGVFFALGAQIAALIFLYLADKKGMKTDGLLARLLIIFAVGLLAARIGFFLVYPEHFQSLKQVLAIWQGGLVSYFGLLVGLITAYFLFKKSQEGVVKWLDILVIASLFGWGIGRIGNYLAADSVGIELLSSPFYQRLPIQLLETLVTWLLGTVLLVKYQLEVKPGEIAIIGLIGYFLARFVIDIWRDEAILFWIVKPSMFISLLLCLFFIAIRKKLLNDA